MKPEITAAILAGGQSRRMGKPKALLELQGKPLLNILADVLAPSVKQVVVAGVPEVTLYDSLGLKVIPDNIPDGGPLAGMEAAMSAADTEWLLTVPCDGILLPENFPESLWSHTDDTVDVVTCQDADRDQPLYALVRCSLQPSLKDFLDQGERKVGDWLSAQRCVVADFSADGFRFSNLNTPQDLQQFESEYEK